MNKKVEKIINKATLGEAINLLSKLISVNTVNPPGNEINVKPIIQPVAKTLGGKLKIIQGKKGRANFIIQIGNGSPSVGFFPHLDTVPPGDGWKTDPFKPIIKGGKLYGRGSIDSKGNYATSFAAIKTFLANHKKFKGTIYLLGCADEEMGSRWGVHYLLENGFKVDYAIIPDGGDIDRTIIGEKGVIRLKVKSIGIQAHGSTPEQGINAVENLVRFLHKITEMKLDDIKFHEYFEGITRNIGTIKGGHAANIVPGYAEAELDFRIPVGVDKKEIIKRIKEEVKEIEKKYKGKFEFEEELFLTPHITNADTQLLKCFLAAAKDLGLPMKVETSGGITDAKPLSLAGIQTIVHSADNDSGTAHGANEYVVIENMRRAAALYYTTLEKIFEV